MDEEVKESRAAHESGVPWSETVELVRGAKSHHRDKPYEPLTLARAIEARLREDPTRSTMSVAKELGHARTWVLTYLNILGFPPRVQQLFQKQEDGRPGLRANDVLTLRKIPDKDEQYRAARELIRDQTPGKVYDRRFSKHGLG